ncbi:MAG: HNH endonuclease, partial [Nocardioidaceae bacterium]
MFEDMESGYDDHDADAILARAAANTALVKLAQAQTLVLAARWADLHGACLADHPEHPGRSLPGIERLVGLGGEGTPEVAEFAPAELATELGISDGAGRHLVADALDLRHRLPGLWAKVTAGDVRVFVAR